MGILLPALLSRASWRKWCPPVATFQLGPAAGGDSIRSLPGAPLPLPSPAGEKCQGRTGGEEVLAADGCSSSQPSREHEAPGAGCWAPVAILLLGPAARPSPGGGGLGGLPEDGKGELPGLGHDPLRPGGLPGAES